MGEQDIMNLERQWSRRLWGYGEKDSAATPRCPRPPSAGCNANRAEWKPWPIAPVRLQLATDSPAPARRACDATPPKQGALRSRPVNNECQGLRAEERLRNLSPLSHSERA